MDPERAAKRQRYISSHCICTCDRSRRKLLNRDYEQQDWQPVTYGAAESHWQDIGDRREHAIYGEKFGQIADARGLHGG